MVIAMGGHYFIRDAEQYFDMAASTDKDYYRDRGRGPRLTPCTACQTTPGQYSNVTKNLVRPRRRSGSTPASEALSRVEKAREIR
jgi:hypothetical protein